MAIYVIGDLHLSFGVDKPMDIFGEKWKKHENKIKEDWINNVDENDYVILPGDFSWATYIEDAKLDFEYINNLPGKKLLLKGNHDYWWSTVTKMRKYIQENNFKNIDFIFNNSYECEDTIIVGARGWDLTPGEENEKMINREVARLELSLKDAIEKFKNEKEIVAFMHYPPITKTQIEQNIESPFINMMKKYNIKRCYYGHLHADSIKYAVEGIIDGIELKLVSADGLDFKLYKI